MFGPLPLDLSVEVRTLVFCSFRCYAFISLPRALANWRGIYTTTLHTKFFAHV